jgi:hypothetical protein
MKHPNFAEQDNSDATSFALADFGAEVNEERLDVSPGNITARGVRKHLLQCSPALPLHAVWYREMVPSTSELRFGSLPPSVSCSAKRRPLQAIARRSCHAAAHSADSKAACSITVCVAFSCLSGG